MNLRKALFALVLGAAACVGLQAQITPDINWLHISTHLLEIPLPSTSLFQTAAIVGDLDQDGVNDFIIAGKSGVPSVTLYKRLTNGWVTYEIEKSALPIETGGTLFDIDGDGYPDLVLGGDLRSNELWWWENPRPPYDSRIGWRRHTIKRGGKDGHMDQVFGDFKGTGHPQLVFWNQGARTLYLAEIPPNPKSADVWPYYEILSPNTIEPGPFVITGLAVADVDGDGRPDIIAGNHWLKHQGENSFKATRFAPMGGRIVAGHFLQGVSAPQIVVSVPDGRAPLRFYQFTGDPADPKKWTWRDLFNRPLQHCFTLQAADFNGDGQLDIFAAEMVKWTANPNTVDNKDAGAWIFYGNGRGQFRFSQFITGHDFHEAKVADLDGDGDMDILYKPYRLDTPRVDAWLQNGTGLHVNAPLKKFMQPMGLALSIFGDGLRTNLVNTLAWAAQAGLNDVEVPNFAGMPAVQYRKHLDSFKLKSSVVYFPYVRFEKEFEKVAAEAKAMGAEYVVCSEMRSKGVLTIGDINRAANDFNQWALHLRPYHFRFCYAPQGGEFAKLGTGTILEDLMAKTTVGSIGFVLSVPAAVLSGVDPLQLLRKHPNRFPILNLADLRQVSSTGQTNSTIQFSSVIMGKGQVNIPQLLMEASRAGVQRYYIEDRSTQAIEQIPQSLLFLRQLRFN